MARAFNKGSYTNYSNKIGLYSKLKGSFISNSRDVVLNFPYKDCVLVGGMTKEDAKRDEKFLNGDALLANNDIKDIDVLLDPKVFTNFKYVSGGGERSLSANDDIEFFDEDGELKQNLLIKGNNLIALYSLYPRLAGKVKLIYIDPPYYFREEKQSDTFRYNTNFKLSAWLTFMKNRLDIAKRLMRQDGVILISIDDDGQPYLRVMLDEIFGANNFIANFVWRRSGAGGLRSNLPVTTHEYIAAYAINKGQITDEWDAPYSEQSAKDFKYNDANGRYKLQALYLTSLKPSSTQGYGIECPNGEFVFPPKGRGAWRFTRDTYEKWRSDDLIVFRKSENTPLLNGDGKRAEYNIYTKQYMQESGSNPSTILQDELVGQTRTSKAELQKLGLKNEFAYAKPEELISFMVGMITNPGDLVLDYHLGSGTTAAVAHKMGRRWIGIEQMDYIETIAKRRLEKVIAGEQGGISKSVGWQGGGDFVYMELKKYNQDYVDRIWAAQTYGELDAIKDEMLQNAFLKFWFTKADFDAKWRDGEINARKVELINLLDANQLYLNYADMDDDKYKVSDDDKALTKRFYGPDEDGEEISADVDIDDITDDGDDMETNGE